MEYEKFLKSKEKMFEFAGFDINKNDLNDNMFEYQKDCVLWALKKGRCALFQDCGLGKTIQQLEWSNQVCKITGGKVLILAPLAVSKQTKREGEKFGIKVNIVANQEDVQDGINITNYEKLHKFNIQEFQGIVIDESSILKSFTGKLRDLIITSCQNIPYKLACTATPAPNDYMELGNHSEFLGIMKRSEMLSMFFVHDGGNTSEWRLKGHAKDKFWKWVSSWSVVLKNPKDLGYDDKKFELPKLNIEEIVVKDNITKNTLIPMVANTLQERREAVKSSMKYRIDKASELVNNSSDQWLIWCNYNDESTELKKVINEGVEVTGSDTDEHKTNSMLDFSEGKIKALISKVKIAGFGMNFQSCHNIIFCGMNDSYEKFYQAVRRCWRFGQKNDVNVYIIIGQRETSIINNIKRKQSDADSMQDEMLKYTKDILKENITHTHREITDYNPKIKMILPKWLEEEK